MLKYKKGVTGNPTACYSVQKCTNVLDKMNVHQICQFVNVVGISNITSFLQLFCFDTLQRIFRKILRHAKIVQYIIQKINAIGIYSLYYIDYIQMKCYRKFYNIFDNI